MRVLTAAQSREADRKAIEDLGIPASALMENAGRRSFEVLQRQVPDLSSKRVAVVCGKGNNGGDGRVVVRLLRGVAKDVHLFETSSVEAGFETTLGGFDIIIDAVFGSGLSRDVVGIERRVIKAINASKKWVLSLDLPSGLSADTGLPLGVAVKANVTVTMGKPKLGLVSAESVPFVGRLEVVDIGIPDAVYNAVGSRVRWVTIDAVRRLFFSRAANTHKGTYGHLLLVGGSETKPGAILLSGRAALRTGAGLATVAIPDKAFRKFPKNFLELMYEPLPSGAAGTFSRKALKKMAKILEGKKAIVAGPGMGVNEDTRAMVHGLIHDTDLPLVLDADALNCISPISREVHLTPFRKGIVLTPHPGEMSRLAEKVSASIRKDRIKAASSMAQGYGVTVVLKGYRTLTATPEGEVFVNATGNPGMATAGMGDVLTGIIGSLLAQGMALTDAVVAGVWLHGRAGDRVAARLGDRGLLASDVIDEIPLVIRELIH